ncbi:MAG: replicative DNA helicase [Flavobacterium sp.]|nr:MAG: replicative DNA helicase [Flavobacterium sp.]
MTQNTPQAVSIEESVIGAMLIDKKGIDEALMVIKTADVFYNESNKYIFQAIVSLFDDNEAVDFLTVSARLRTMGLLAKAGGDVKLIQLTQKVSSSAHIEYHARLLLQFFIKRKIISICNQISSNAYDETYDALDLLNDLSRSLDELSGLTLSGKSMMAFIDLLNAVEKRVEFLSHKNPDEVTGVFTGFKKIDLFTGGYQPGELVILAARPGMGKTALVLATAIANAKRNNPVGIISLEMSAVGLATRIVAIDSDFHLNQLVKNGFEKREYFQSFTRHKHRMKDYPIYIDDDGSASDIRDIITTFRMWKRKFGIKLGIVDYLQLSGDKTKGNNREQEISSVSRKLKLLAKELEIPIIALSQLSRKVEERGGDKRPRLSDLRESGAIEQDADIIQFIYRPEYYGIEPSDDLLSIDCNTELHFAKYRNGGLETKGLKWIGDKTKFYDPDEFTSADVIAMPEKPLPTVSATEAFGDEKPKDNADNDVPF